VSWGRPAALLLGVALASGPPGDAPLPAAAADAGALQRALQGVERERPSPSAAAYLAMVMERAARALSRLLQPLAEALHLGQPVVVLVSRAALAIAGILLAVLLVRVLRASRRRPAGVPAVLETRAASAAVPHSRAAAWRTELDVRLGAGDVAGGLEALWWFLARSVAAADVDPSWTSQDVLSRAGREDLGPLAARLDRLVYGPVRPALADVRALLAGVERALDAERAAS